MAMKYFRLGELFCGPGGLAYGAILSESKNGQYGIKHEWASDYDEDTCKTYRKNICPDNPDSVIHMDVRDLPIDELKPIDAFAYGFPCNSFSIQGKHKGIENKEFGGLYAYGIKVLEKFHPKWFIAENVSGIRTAGSKDFHRILSAMRNAGYKLNVHLYKAEEYGVPQLRHRYIIVGIRKDLDVEFKIPSTEPYKNIDISSRTALKDIPADADNNEQKKLRERVIGKLLHTLPGQNIWQAMKNPDFPDEYRIKENYSFSQIYRKLDPDKPSYTLTANGGGGTWGYYWEGAREITNRERARIQTFPDTYSFVGKYASVRKQIGMAVPVKLSRVVCEAVLNSFAGIDYPSIDMTKREKELALGISGEKDGRHDKRTTPNDNVENSVEGYEGRNYTSESSLEEGLSVQKKLEKTAGEP